MEVVLYLQKITAIIADEADVSVRAQGLEDGTESGKEEVIGSDGFKE